MLGIVEVELDGGFSFCQVKDITEVRFTGTEVFESVSVGNHGRQSRGIVVKKNNRADIILTGRAVQGVVYFCTCGGKTAGKECLADGAKFLFRDCVTIVDGGRGVGHLAVDGNYGRHLALFTVEVDD